MLRIDQKGGTFTPLINTRFAEAGLLERQHLQRMITSSPDAFFEELGESLLLLDEEVHPAEAVEDRADLLALDPDGAVVVIELKRGCDRNHLGQALSYAAMIREWDSEGLIQLLAKRRSVAYPQAEEQVTDFLDADPEAINKQQRVILIAEDFDYATLVTARFLTDAYGVEIHCYRMELSTHEDRQLLTCQRVLPVMDLEDLSMKRGRRRSGIMGGRYGTWAQALDAMDNPHEKAFYQRQIEAGREGLANYGELYYRVHSKRRWRVMSRPDFAFTVQAGRFEGDEAFWRGRLSEPDGLKVVRSGKALRFYLHTQADFEAFAGVAESPPAEVDFDAGGHSGAGADPGDLSDDVG